VGTGSAHPGASRGQGEDGFCSERPGNAATGRPAPLPRPTSEAPGAELVRPPARQFGTAALNEGGHSGLPAGYHCCQNRCRIQVYEKTRSLRSNGARGTSLPRSRGTFLRRSRNGPRPGLHYSTRRLGHAARAGYKCGRSRAEAEGDSLRSLGSLVSRRDCLTPTRNGCRLRSLRRERAAPLSPAARTMQVPPSAWPALAAFLSRRREPGDLLHSPEEN
jgi:hypothetical protein